MKRFLVSLLICLAYTNVFGVPGDIKQNTHVDSILIPRPILEETIKQDDKLSTAPGAFDKMMAYYDKVAGPFGQEKITVNDVYQICIASEVITEKPECLERIFNPVLAKMGHVRFMNACKDKITGGTAHCIDDVFVASKKENANKYHQDVNVSQYSAYGFAIEYAKKHGHEVWCSSEIQDGLKCTTLDNKDFYTFKFAGTNNTADSTIEKNLVKGICALFDSEMPALAKFKNACKMNCGAGTEARNVIQKFGLNVHDGFSTDTQCEIYRPEYTAEQVQKYPGYEYMSDTFKSVQTVLDSQLISVLKEYVKLQGIDVQSFECDYAPKKYHDEIQGGSWAGMPTSADDMLSCRVNDTPVDFIFDDLFESKEYEQRAGKAALQCILSDGQYGTDRMCRGLTRAQCDEASGKVPGGTRWDSKAELCILNRADSARRISNTIQITGGVVLSVGLTFATGGGAAIALIAGAGSVAFDAAFIGLERLQILEPASRARAFAEDAQKCEIPTGSKNPSCSIEQVNCATRVINEHFARLDEILGDLNPEQLSLVSDLMENISDCLDDQQLSSAVMLSTPKFEDRVMDMAGIGLFVAGIFVSPENTVTKWATKAPKIARILKRCTMVERVSGTLNGAKYMRIYVDNLDAPSIQKLVEAFKAKGVHVSSNMVQGNNRRFIAVADMDIFKNWNFSSANWLITDDIIKKYNGYLRRGSSTLGGKDYYRFYVNPGNKEANLRMIEELQAHGFYVSSGATTDEYFIAASYENIFKPWNQGPSDWFDVITIYGGEVRRKSSTLGGKDYYRFYVNPNNTTYNAKLVEELKARGLHVSSNTTKNGHFVAAPPDDIFSPWEADPDNWLKYGTNGNNGSGGARNAGANGAGANGNNAGAGGARNAGANGNNAGANNAGGAGNNAGANAAGSASNSASWMSSEALSHFRAKDSNYRFEMGEINPAHTPTKADRKKVLTKWGMSETADADAVKKRYRELQRKFHPDLNNEFASEAERVTQHLNAEKEILDKTDQIESFKI